jgi:hypothetical protein
MLTGHSEKKRVMAARDAGVTEFLAKPISAKALYQRIINVVANPRPFIKTKTYFGPDREPFHVAVEGLCDQPCRLQHGLHGVVILGRDQDGLHDAAPFNCARRPSR